MLQLGDNVVLNALEKAKEEEDNLERMTSCKITVQSVRLNLNSFSEYQLMKDFRFLLPGVRKISDKLRWPGVTTRNSYVCDQLIACALFLYKRATTSRWYVIELKFGMCTSRCPKYSGNWRSYSMKTLYIC